MKPLSTISHNRALLVLSALGFFCASSGLVSAENFAQGNPMVHMRGEVLQKSKGAKTTPALQKSQKQKAGPGGGHVILGHEDRGMMQSVRTKTPKTNRK
ncbi:MAG: hypothetical protein WA418_19565 [Bradyrhizobium sp.]